MKSLKTDFPLVNESFANETGPKISMYVPYGPRASTTKLALLNVARGLLLSEIGSAKCEQLLEPIAKWQPDSNAAGTVGIFRSESKYLFVHLPVELPPKVIVSETFHLKPLIWCKQRSQWARVVVLGENSTVVYEVSPHETVGPIVYSLSEDSFKPDLLRALGDPTETQRQYTAHVFGGNIRKIQELLEARDWQGSWSAFAKSVASAGDIEIMIREARRMLMAEALKNQRAEIKALLNSPRTILEYRPTKIIEAIHKNQVRKVFVSLEDTIWGELDFSTGKVKYHPRQANTRDDDILDDLIELSASKGVEYIVVPKSMLPVGVSAIAC